MLTNNTAARTGRPRTSALWERILEAAKAPIGVSAAELRINGGNAQDVLKKLVAEGRLHRVAINSKLVRYFTRAEDAERVRALRDKPAPGLQSARPAHKRAPWPADAPMVITPATKHTIAPTPPRALRSNTHLQF